MLVLMTCARSLLIPPGSPGTFHCVSRCVRRAFLCGADSDTGQSFEHRRRWVEDRLHELADVFAVAIWGYAVMSNHVHVVVQTLPEAVEGWSDDEVATRWTRLFSRQDADEQLRAEVLAGNADRIATLRSRLSDLSWFMRCLSEPIARRANREDSCKGRFMSMDGRYAGFAGAKTGLGRSIQVSSAARRGSRRSRDGVRRTLTPSAPRFAIRWKRRTTPARSTG